MMQLFEDSNAIGYSFKNDYSEGAHPNILEALAKSNLSQQEGYGLDDFSIEAIKSIKKLLDNENCDIHFVAGGTQANLIVISSILKPYESVISAETGHINTHETGAIEATGHKVNAVDTKDGKLTPEIIKPILEFHADEHMVKPRLVYISNSTELGTIYKKKEIEEISSFCREHDLFLFLDGARLGSALTADENDLTLAEVSGFVDAFYIGGTKNGALLGEAIVINNDNMKINFRYNIKQKGGLLSKGRLLGIQFQELFRDDLFFKLAKHSNEMAGKLSDGIEALGYHFLSKSVTNQIFPILPDKIIEELQKKYSFYIWNKAKNHMSSIRLVTSWATKEEAVDSFLKDLASYNYK